MFHTYLDGICLLDYDHCSSFEGLLVPLDWKGLWGARVQLKMSRRRRTVSIYALLSWSSTPGTSTSNLTLRIAGFNRAGTVNIAVDWAVQACEFDGIYHSFPVFDAASFEAPSQIATSPTLQYSLRRRLLPHLIDDRAIIISLLSRPYSPTS
ncbi:uncharacterized protein ARMOST_19075 [Armillaria ostoyae]|uniref:Uncharacterized protein n=1 Tax=Armillaria ostoyae TaxID=47428 RepID=A0A284S3L9_ARMOS|nr:uncharacterized protein ARMOST_19075 [Armillaria ostoyae]